MRIVAGELRGGGSSAPPAATTRPTTDKVREAVFNALASLDVVVDAHVVDLYAGSGALGIEALSRGAAHCTFVERDRGAVRAIDENIAALGLRGRQPGRRRRRHRRRAPRLRRRPRLRRPALRVRRLAAPAARRRRPTSSSPRRTPRCRRPPDWEQGAGEALRPDVGHVPPPATPTRPTPAPALPLSGTHDDRALSRQLRPDPPRAPRRHRAGASSCSATSTSP